MYLRDSLNKESWYHEQLLLNMETETNGRRSAGAANSSTMMKMDLSLRPDQHKLGIVPRNSGRRSTVSIDKDYCQAHLQFVNSQNLVTCSMSNSVSVPFFPSVVDLVVGKW